MGGDGEALRHRGLKSSSFLQLETSWLQQLARDRPVWQVFGLVARWL